MLEAIREFAAALVAALRREGPVTRLLAAWYDIYVRRTEDPDAPVAYRLT